MINNMTEQQKELVEKYYDFIHWIMHKRFNNIPLNSAEYEDISQIGYLALCKAAKNWDPDKGSFSAYAFKCCLGTMIMYWNRNISFSFNIRESNTTKYNHIPIYSLEGSLNNDKDDNFSLDDIISDDNQDDYKYIEILIDSRSAYKKASKK